MARGYLMFIVLAGIFAWIAGGLVSPPAGNGPGRSTHMVGEAPTDSTAASAEAENPADANDGAVRLERDSNGHFYADVQINGATINALVDTGASGIALSREDARKAGLATSIGMPNVIGQGADGEVYGEMVTLGTVSLGAATAEGVRAMVLNAGEQTLLGQDFLSRFDTVEIKGDTMVLR